MLLLCVAVWASTLLPCTPCFGNGVRTVNSVIVFDGIGLQETFDKIAQDCGRLKGARRVPTGWMDRRLSDLNRRQRVAAVDALMAELRKTRDDGDTGYFGGVGGARASLENFVFQTGRNATTVILHCENQPVTPAGLSFL